ncbi:PREDICTED: uncharacterized protein LOC104807057 [Tarenaya hassleriana]|uniref:uncharacterized protein LOC104807057 n=1 Tax=Tarenaya hassleriana TaxID=28532 RepID=UPI00053C42F0|nr:PREDICTED: uncharacterized protein LOC104807057 [Tarenaya hassleriana]
MENERDFALPDGVEGNADSTFAQYNTPRHTELLAGIRLPAIDMSSFELNPSTIQMLSNNAFRAHRTQEALSSIHSFKQDHGESLYNAWKRYKGYQKSCPHHGLDKNYLINTFLRGLIMDTKTLIQASCGGSIQNKSFVELEDHIGIMAQQEDAPSEYSRDPPKECNDQTMQIVLEQLVVLNAKLEDSNRPSRTKHLILTQEELGMYALDERLEGVNYVANNSYSNTYNPGWKNHPNLSYKSNNVENPTPNNFRASNNRNQRIPSSFTFQSKGPNQNSNYRGNSETNPREHVNAITLRSGKQVDSGDPPMVEQGDSSRTTVLDTPDDTPEPAYVPPPPRPPPFFYEDLLDDVLKCIKDCQNGKNRLSDYPPPDLNETPSAASSRPGKKENQREKPKGSGVKEYLA